MNMWQNIKIVQDEGEHVSKYIFEKDDAVAEAVLYRYPDYKTRTVICCSTQSGCPVGCRFCGAGDYFVRSLTADEICEQVNRCLLDTHIHPNNMYRCQIMFMSMGEPLLNMKSLAPAIRRLNFLYEKAALLISTSAPKVNYEDVIQLSIDVPTVGLQFSIHESTDEARDKLIPFKAKLNLGEIAQMGELWCARVGRKPFFNYCAHDKNSSEEDADRILALFDPRIWCATISVICERGEWMKAKNERQRELASSFMDRLTQRGYDTRMFDPAGQDTIGGGCGQLWFVQSWMKNNGDSLIKSIGFGKDVVHAPK